MAQKLNLDGNTVWLKSYERRSFARPLLDATWNGLAKGMKLRPLVNPPHRSAEATRATEQRRLEELRALGVRVPEVIGYSRRSLLLSDIGTSLSARLKRASGPEDIDHQLQSVATSMARVHRAGGFLGQAFPRNITLSSEGVGFIDFEDDPSEIMDLDAARARDWIMFTAGVARYYEHRQEKLTALLASTLPRIGNQRVQEISASTADQLNPIRVVAGRLGTSARAAATAIVALQSITAMLLIVAALIVDFVSDGDLDTLVAFRHLL